MCGDSINRDYRWSVSANVGWRVGRSEGAGGRGWRWPQGLVASYELGSHRRRPGRGWKRYRRNPPVHITSQTLLSRKPGSQHQKRAGLCPRFEPPRADFSVADQVPGGPGIHHPLRQLEPPDPQQQEPEADAREGEPGKGGGVPQWNGLVMGGARPSMAWTEGMGGGWG